MSSKVIDFGTNRKRVCDFLLVRYSNLGPMLRFRDIAGFCAADPQHYSALILGVFPLHKIAQVGVSPSVNLKLLSREIIFEIFQPVKNTMNVTDARSHRQTDDFVSSLRNAYYTVSQKKLCQLIFDSLSVKYEPISIKTGRIVPEETLNETVPKLPTSPKVCACTTLGNLKCQIEPSTE